MARKASKQRDGIYTRPDRPGFWITWVDAQGRRRYRKTDAANITQAKMIRQAELVRVEQAKALGFNPPGEETFAEVATRYLQHQRARISAKAYEREKGIIEIHLTPFFRGVKLSAVRRADVQRYITKRSGEVGAATVTKELNTIKHLLRLAVEWEIIPLNPAQGVKAPKVPAGRVRYLHPAEIRLLLDMAPEWLRPIIAIAVSTGMRRGEIVGLRWLDVDFVHRRILLPQTKNGDGRVVYLNQIATAVFETLLNSREVNPLDKIFPNVREDYVTGAFKRACVRAKIQDFHFHDLRHTAASLLRMAGADIHTVAQLLGHKDLRMAQRYQHLSPAYLADAVAKLDGVLGEIRYQDVTSPEKLLQAGKLNDWF